MDEVQEQPLKRGLFLHPIIQILISGIGATIAILLALVLFAAGIISLLEGSAGADDFLPFFNMGWSALLVCALLLPSLIIPIRHLAGKPPSKTGRTLFIPALIGLLLWVPLVLVGHWIAQKGWVTWLLLPVIQLFGIALPIFFWIELARRKLNPAFSDYSWGVFSFGVVIVQPLVILAEIMLILLIGLLFLLWAGMQPELLNELSRLGQRVMDAQMDPNMLETILLPYLQNPKVIYLGLAIGAGLIPLLEELLKPLALWLMIGRKFSAQEGFILGLIAGGTFALLESLGMMASAGELGWSSVVIARLGTGILHVTTTAMVGWGLGAAWKRKKYVQLGGLFLLSFSLHSIWNLFGLLVGIVPLLPAPGSLGSLVVIGPLALGVLGIAMLLILVGGNRRLRKVPSNPVEG